MKKYYQTLLVLWLLSATVAVMAQGGTTTTTDEPQTTVQIFYVACEDLGVMNLTGVAQPGFSIFFQLYSGAGATGDALTNLRRANVSGDYAFSERTPYTDGRRVAPGAIGSARVLIAPTNAPENPSFETTVDDIQDGCNDAQNPLQSSDDAGDPVRSTGSSSGIASPDGGLLNPEIVLTPEPQVVLGPRRTVQDARRTANPGLIFAQCDNFYPDTDPGLVYDSDNVRIYWYWFATTEELVAQNLSKTVYEVRLNSAPMTQVAVSGVTQRDGFFYVFYTVPVGNLAPGFYEVEFKQDWTELVNDGLDDYGPGSGVPNIRANCNFKVEPNPTGARVQYSGLYNPMTTPSHDYERAIIQRQVIQEYIENFSNIGQR